MKIQTFSVVVGGKKCNAHCPYCVSKMTGKDDCTEKINIRNFHKACQFAQMSGVSTVLLTGKGEPTLYPEHISKYLELIKLYNFPFLELQTNGIELQNGKCNLIDWYEQGLTTVSLSCVHWNTDRNREIFGKDFVSLEENIKLLHRFGFSVRLSCVMIKDYIDSVDSVIGFTKKCKEWGVEQFTVRPVAFSNIDIEKEDIVRDWVQNNFVPHENQKEIEDYFKGNATLLLELAHGAKVYDYDGQNISINTCLTHSPNPDKVRQLIYFPDGHLRYSWVYPGAIIM